MLLTVIRATSERGVVVAFFALLRRTSRPLASTVLPRVLQMQTPPRRAAHKRLETRSSLVAGTGFEPVTFRL